ncbi:hypothetical protein TYRP_005437 [Tyrophagus putrescentiae]|nr:hypothetical protein TYRP_005437 [Tyrophagus putrescentiae]
MRRDQFILDRLLEFSIRQQLSCCSCAPFQCTCALISSSAASSSSSFSTSSSTDKPKKCSKKHVNSLAFNDFELNHLKELQSANGHLVDESSLPVAKVETSFENVVNLPVLYLKLVIKYCKALLPDFAHFSEACQMALLKAFFTDFIFIRIAFNYDPSSGEFRYISDETATSTILIKTGNFSDVKIKPILDAILAVAIEIGRILNHDTMLKDLFTALVFCQPQAAEVVGENREFLKYHYYKYSKLMQRYLEVKTGSPKAAQELHHLLLGYAHQMATGKAFLAAIFQEVGVANVHGILAEVYDLALGQTQQQQQSQPQQQSQQQHLNTSENTTFE